MRPVAELVNNVRFMHSSGYDYVPIETAMDLANALQARSALVEAVLRYWSKGVPHDIGCIRKQKPDERACTCGVAAVTEALCTIRAVEIRR